MEDLEVKETKKLKENFNNSGNVTIINIVTATKKIREKRNDICLTKPFK